MRRYNETTARANAWCLNDDTILRSSGTIASKQGANATKLNVFSITQATRIEIASTTMLTSSTEDAVYANKTQINTSASNLSTSMVTMPSKSPASHGNFTWIASAGMMSSPNASAIFQGGGGRTGPSSTDTFLMFAFLISISGLLI